MKAVQEIKLGYRLAEGSDENYSHLAQYFERKILAGLLIDFPTGVEDRIMELYEERYQEAVSIWRIGRQEARRARAIASREAARPIGRIKKWLDSMRLHHLN